MLVRRTINYEYKHTFGENYKFLKYNLIVYLVVLGDQPVHLVENHVLLHKLLEFLQNL